MEKNSIQPASPIQTRQFLLPDEEVLYIGSTNYLERNSWMALSDFGRLLIFSQTKVDSNKSSRTSFFSLSTLQRDSNSKTDQTELDQTNRHKKSSRKSSLVKEIFSPSTSRSISRNSSAVLPLDGSELQSKDNLRITLADSSGKSFRRNSLKSQNDEQSDGIFMHGNRRRNSSLSDRNNSPLEAVSQSVTRNTSFLIEEENVYISDGVKERRTLVIEQNGLTKDGNLFDAHHRNESSRDMIPLDISLSEVVQIDNNCRFYRDKNNLTITRLEQSVKLCDIPAEEWQSRMEMAILLTL